MASKIHSEEMTTNKVEVLINGKLAAIGYVPFLPVSRTEISYALHLMAKTLNDPKKEISDKVATH